MNYTGTYAVKDLPVAAYLKYMKVKLVSAYSKEKGAWVFENIDHICEKYELEVRNGEALISVAEYEATRKNILGMAHSIS
jgi:hypothetical protein